MEAAIFSAILLVAILFIICIVKIVSKGFLFKNGELSCFITLIPVNGKNEEIEYTVRSLLWDKAWGKYTGQYILLVLIDCDAETYKICEKLSEEFESVSFCKSSELESFISNPSSVSSS